MFDNDAFYPITTEGSFDFFSGVPILTYHPITRYTNNLIKLFNIMIGTIQIYTLMISLILYQWIIGFQQALQQPLQGIQEFSNVFSFF